MTEMSTSNKGLFISFEGIDGCGKSTQVQLLMDKLEKEGVDSMLVREPGGSTISEEIRNILLKTRSETMSARAEALLMTASRAQLTKDTILPALERGTCVIADRYQDSTLAYQGGGRGLDVDYLIQLNTFSTYALDPDLTFYIDISSEEGLKRSGTLNPDRIESAGLKFQEKVREQYLKLAQRYPNRFIIIDGTATIEGIHGTIWEKIINCLNDTP